MKPCCAITKHGSVEVVCLLMLWNFNEFLEIIINHINHFPVKSDCSDSVAIGDNVRTGRHWGRTESGGSELTL